MFSALRVAPEQPEGKHQWLALSASPSISLLVSEVSFAKQACRLPSLTILLQSEVSWHLIVTGTGLLGVTTVQSLVWDRALLA